MDQPLVAWRETDASGADVFCLLVPGTRPSLILYRQGKVECVLAFERLEDAHTLARQLRSCLLDLSGTAAQDAAALVQRSPAA